MTRALHIISAAHQLPLPTTCLRSLLRSSNAHISMRLLFGDGKATTKPAAAAFASSRSRNLVCALSAREACTCARTRHQQSIDDDLATWGKYLESDELGVDELQNVLDRNQRNRESPSVPGTCYGCGVTLQIANPDSLGYVSPDRYWKKREYSKKKAVSMLCARCAYLPSWAWQCT